ncbi:LysE family translocator [Pseudodesulfovibrio sp. zrk46]|uniref:LysE family translocator n=1 Tax=Pseudodesulfovibrio sp. zrk46 TaxID=2725288 RepID=UPI001449876D|nr:LysE family translocator [Pseudodesulfovibrio sp. zrk46]QJB56921.1 LysE family translocator [Pseudodesulfovibrio sp. zrk46]
MINDYALYLVLAFSITAIPGPAVILTIKNSLKYGYRSTIANILGNFSAMVILATISAAGLGAVLMSSAMLFSAMKILGCLYLVYLGIMAWRAPAVAVGQSVVAKQERRSFLALFKEGFGVGLSNPKAIAFFTALFPQFIDPSRAYVPQFLTLILTIEGVSTIVLSSYALLASMVSPMLSSRKAMGYFNKLTGAAFVGFGVALVCDE